MHHAQAALQRGNKIAPGSWPYIGLAAELVQKHDADECGAVGLPWATGNCCNFHFGLRLGYGNPVRHRATTIHHIWWLFASVW